MSSNAWGNFSLILKREESNFLFLMWMLLFKDCSVRITKEAFEQALNAVCKYIIKNFKWPTIRPKGKRNQDTEWTEHYETEMASRNIKPKTKGLILTITATCDECKKTPACTIMAASLYLILDSCSANTALAVPHWKLFWNELNVQMTFLNDSGWISSTLHSGKKKECANDSTYVNKTQNFQATNTHEYGYEDRSQQLKLLRTKLLINCRAAVCKPWWRTTGGEGGVKCWLLVGDPSASSKPVLWGRGRTLFNPCHHICPIITSCCRSVQHNPRKSFGDMCQAVDGARSTSMPSLSSSTDNWSAETLAVPPTALSLCFLCALLIRALDACRMP